VLPDAVTDPFFDRTRTAQQEQLHIIEEGFAPVPVLRVPLASVEPVGRRALATFAKSVYGKADPRAAMHTGDLLRVTRDADSWRLELDLPFGQRGQVDLVRRDGELIVSIGPYRRALVLPDSLRDRQVLDASLHDGTLTVLFDR
jgi:arsenite-transporting ATPase